MSDAEVSSTGADDLDRVSVTEEQVLEGSAFSLYQAGLWRRQFPWLVHGITLRLSPAGDEFDLGVGGTRPVGEVLSRWRTLREELAFHTVVLSEQVHGSTIRVARGGSGGFQFSSPGDGHLTREAGVLLAVSIADCVPIFLVEPRSRVLGLLHAGWRGVAAGIVEQGVDAMYRRFGISPGEVHVYLGPAISRARYPVGAEVFDALGRTDLPGDGCLDLRQELARRLLRQGIESENLQISQTCVHDDPRFFSHRKGDAGRQVALLGYLGRPGSRR